MGILVYEAKAFVEKLKTGVEVLDTIIVCNEEEKKIILSDFPDLEVEIEVE